MLVDSFGRPLRPARIPKKKGRPKKQPRRRPSIANDVLASHRATTVTLTARHTVMGHTYGPGQVTVERQLAQVLMDQDQRAQAADAAFFSTKSCVIGPGYGGLMVRRVSPHFFDVPELELVPLGVVDRETGQFHMGGNA